jgi:hypothetical protein
MADPASHDRVHRPDPASRGLLALIANGPAAKAAAREPNAAGSRDRSGNAPGALVPHAWFAGAGGS